MKEIPGDKCLWHHVASLYSKKLQYYEIDPVAVFLGQYRGDLPGDCVVFKTCQLTASWLRRPHTSNWFQMKVSLCDVLEKSCSSSTENGVICSPHVAKKTTHGGKEQRVRETKWNKINKNENSSWTLAVKSHWEICKTVLHSSVLAEFWLLQPWQWATRTDVTIWLNWWHFTSSNGAFFKNLKPAFVPSSTVRGEISWLVSDPSPPSRETRNLSAKTQILGWKIPVCREMFWSGSFLDWTATDNLSSFLFYGRNIGVIC